MKLIRQLSVGVAASLAGAQVAFAAGIPQMDRTWYPNQLLWLAVSFVVLYVIVSRFIAPTIGGLIAIREAAINDAIREAEKAKQTAEMTRHQFESEGQGARSQAGELLAKAQAANSSDAAAASAKLDHELSRKLESAQTRINAARDKALGSMGEVTASLAAEMATKLLGRPVSPESAQGVVKTPKTGTRG